MRTGVAHARSEEHHAVIQQCLSIWFFDRLQFSQESSHLLHMKLFNDRQFRDVLGDFPMMGQLVVAAADFKAAVVGSDIGQTKCDHACRIRFQGQLHQVVIERNAINEVESIGTRGQFVIDHRLWSIKPFSRLC